MLTPDEIASRQFLVALRGYDRDEVAEFLRQVADEHAALQARIRELEDQLDRRPEPSASPVPAVSRSPEPAVVSAADSRDAFRALGEETTRILVAAEESAATIRTKAEERARVELEQARREAREEVEGARRTASKIVADAERRRNTIAEDIRGLESTRDRFLGDLRGAMKSVQGAVRNMQSTSGTTELEVDDDEDPAPATRQPLSRRVEAVPAEASDQEPEAAEPEPEPLDDDAGPEAEVPVAAALVDGTGDAEPEPESDVDVAAAVVEAGDDVLAVEPAEVEVEPGTEAEPDAEAEPASAVGEDARGDGDEAAGALDPVELREQSLAGVRPGMLRRLKRSLQDVQNGVLDAIRQSDDDVLADELLPGDEDLDPLGEVAQMFLTAAYSAGVADGAILADVTAPDEVGDTDRVPTAASTFQIVLANEVQSSLLPSLRAGIEAGEPATSLSERVGEVFRDLKGPVVEGLVEEHLIRVYGYGAVDLWGQEGIAEMTWAVAEEPRCPENRCRTNVSEGPVAVQGEFPSGHQVPPAHDGCVCALLPQRA